jgi:hypothetical protein
MFLLETICRLKNSHSMSSDPKVNEWNLLKEEFDALVHNEGAHRISGRAFMAKFLAVLVS